jgi:hypothetical protein
MTVKNAVSGFLSKLFGRVETPRLSLHLVTSDKVLADKINKVGRTLPGNVKLKTLYTGEYKNLAWREMWYGMLHDNRVRLTNIFMAIVDTYTEDVTIGTVRGLYFEEILAGTNLSISDCQLVKVIFAKRINK